MDKYVVNSIVAYIKRQTGFPFDALDVEDSLEEVLAYYGFHPELDAEERELARKDLLQLALTGQLNEMQRVVDLGLTSGLERVRDTLYGRERFARRPRLMTAEQSLERMRLL